MRTVFLSILLTLTLIVHPGNNYNFNDNCRKAYILTYNLNTHCANELIKKERLENPNNQIVTYLEGTQLFLKTFISPDYSYFQTNKTLIEDKIEAIKNKKENNPYHYFCQAELYLYLSILSVNFNDNYNAARYIKNAYSLYKECLTRHPDFVPAQMGTGYISVALSRIPSKYNWIFSIIGIDTNQDNGIKTLDKSYSYSTHKDTIWKKQNTILISSLRKIYINKGYTDHQYYNKYIAPLEGRTDLISALIVSSQLNLIGQTDKAIDILARQKQNQFFRQSIAQYTLGSMLLQKLDEQAITHLTSFASKCSKANINYQPTIQKMAWHHFIKGNTLKYNELISKIKPQQTTNIPLLKARLLFDGGYVQQSDQTLSTINTSSLTPTEQAEYYYRKGRIAETKHNLSEALVQYNTSISTNLQTRYTASSALRAGNIHKQLNNPTKAESYYRKALKMTFTEYYDEITNDIKRELSTLK